MSSDQWWKLRLAVFIRRLLFSRRVFAFRLLDLVDVQRSTSRTRRRFTIYIPHSMQRERDAEHLDGIDEIEVPLL